MVNAYTSDEIAVTWVQDWPCLEMEEKAPEEKVSGPKPG